MKPSVCNEVGVTDPELNSAPVIYTPPPQPFRCMQVAPSAEKGAIISVQDPYCGLEGCHNNMMEYLAMISIALSLLG